MTSSPISIKCVLVGDPHVGKTSLLHTFSSGRRPSPSDGSLCSLPSLVTVTTHHQNRSYQLQLFDTNGCPTQLRSRLTAYAAYRAPDVILLCADLTEPASWPRLETVWRQELQQHQPLVPLVLAGTKAEARDAIQASALGHGEVVGLERGRRMAAKLGAAAYRECSTVTSYGVAAVFAEVVETALHPDRRLQSRPLSVRDLWDRLSSR